MTLGNFFASLGWTRDDAKWGRLQALSLATLVSSGTVDLQYWAHYLGIPLSVTAQHWIVVVAAITLWVAGKNDTSNLPGKSDGIGAGSVDLRKIAPAILLVLLGGAALSLPACSAHQAPVLTPAQQAAAILQRVDELQNAVISANELTPGAIPDVVAKSLVRFCVEAAKVLKAAPDGVLPAIAAEWRSMKAQVPLKYRQLPAIAAAYLAVDIALAEFGQ
jgi:hypothetical protein